MLKGLATTSSFKPTSARQLNGLTAGLNRLADAGNHLRYRANYNARGASIFAGDSPVGCRPWLGGISKPARPCRYGDDSPNTKTNFMSNTPTTKTGLKLSGGIAGNPNMRVMNFSPGQIVKHILGCIAVMARFDIFADGYQPVSGSDYRRFDVAVFSMLRVACSGA